MQGLSPVGNDMLSAKTPDGSGQMGKLKKNPLLPGKALCRQPGENTRIIEFTANRENTSLGTTTKEDGVNWTARASASYSLAPVHYYFSHLSGTLRQ